MFKSDHARLGRPGAATPLGGAHCSRGAKATTTTTSTKAVRHPRRHEQRPLCVGFGVFGLGLGLSTSAKRNGSLVCHASSSSSGLSVRERVQAGTSLVEAGKLKDGVRELESLVSGPLAGKLTKEEAAAANYNLACAYAQLGEFDKAGDPLVRAVNDYGVKYSVVLGDADLEPFRLSRKFDDIQNVLVGGAASSDAQYAKLRAEATSPFRTFRLFALGGLDAGAGLGLLIITSRLAASINGGPGAPDFLESVRNFGINLTAVVVLTYFFLRDLKQSKEKLKEVEAEEDLGRLLVDLGAKRVVPLSRLRQQYRPVLLIGDESFLKKAIKSAGQFKKDLQSKGVLLIPVLEEQYSWKKGGQSLGESKGFNSSGGSSANGGGAEGEGIQGEQRWVVQPRRAEEWLVWINTQKEGSEGLRYAENMHIQAGLDGTVGSMAPGAPLWKELLKLPDRDSFQSKVTG